MVDARTNVVEEIVDNYVGQNGSYDPRLGVPPKICCNHPSMYKWIREGGYVLSQGVATSPEGKPINFYVWTLYGWRNLGWRWHIKWVKLLGFYGTLKYDEGVLLCSKNKLRKNLHSYRGGYLIICPCQVSHITKSISIHVEYFNIIVCVYKCSIIYRKFVLTVK